MNAGAPNSSLELASLRVLPLKEQVVRELTRLIESGTLQSDARLPSERELAERMQVSRSTVREAVQFLAALGLVEIRHGSGTFVRTSGGEAGPLRDEWRDWVSRHADRIRELLEVRRGLETFAAELACAQASSEGLDALGAALAQMDQAVHDNDVPLCVQADVRFHRALVDAAGNVALTDLMTAVGAQLLQERAATFGIDGRPPRSLAEHAEIYDAVQARDVQRARAAVLAHLVSIESEIGSLVTQHGAEDGHRPSASHLPKQEKGRSNV